MTPLYVIIDADFLSAFLKINQLELIPKFYGVQQLHLTSAVYREVAQTSLLSQLTAIPWLTLAVSPVSTLQQLQLDENFRRLGAGEQESIALALTTANAVLLTNDNRARQIATALGVTAIHIPGLLLACKLAAELTTDEIRTIVDDLWQKDHYKFRRDVKAQLLA